MTAKKQILTIDGKNYIYVGFRVPKRYEHYIFPWEGYVEVHEGEYCDKAIIVKPLEEVSWKPLRGDMYYYPKASWGCADTEDTTVADFIVCQYIWGDETIDETMYEAGLVCKTAEEARKVGEEMLKAATKRFMEGL